MPVPCNARSWRATPLAGVTVMLMDEGLDTGPVLASGGHARCGPREDAGSLGARLAAVGGAVLARSIHGLRAGTVGATPQDPRTA